MCGEVRGYADVALYCTLQQCLSMGDAFDMPRTLAPYPKLHAFYKLLGAEAEPFFASRAQAAQLGYSDAIDFLAATNTPFPWCRRKKG